MLTNRQADDFMRNLYREVWQGYSPEGFSKHYHRNTIARSQGRQFYFDEFHELIESSQEYLSFMRPDFYCTLAQGDDRFTSWFTTVHYNHSNKEVYRINTMGSYRVKDDKIIEVDFMWDKPIDLIMRKNKPEQLLKNKLNALRDLTPSELECFFYLLQGYTAKQVAEIVDRSSRTIESHMSRIKEKLSISNMRECTDFAIANDLLTLSPLLSYLLTNIKGVKDES